jgi:hypothetical protein
MAANNFDMVIDDDDDEIAVHPPVGGPIQAPGPVLPDPNAAALGAAPGAAAPAPAVQGPIAPPPPANVIPDDQFLYPHMHHIPGPHMQFQGPMAPYPPVYGAYQPYSAPWMNQFGYPAYYQDQYQDWQPDPDPIPAVDENAYQMPAGIEADTIKEFAKILEEVNAQLNPSRKEGPELSAHVTKELTKIYEVKKAATDKQLDEVATSIDLPKNFCIGPVPLTNPPIYNNTNEGGQCRDRRFQRMQNLLLSSQAGVTTAFEYLIKHPDNAVWKSLCQTSHAIMELQRMTMQLRVSSLKLAAKNDHLKYLFVGSDATIKMFGEKLFDKNDDDLQKLATD